MLIYLWHTHFLNHKEIPMKIIFSLICISIFLLSATINEQIHALEDASPKERVALMNHIKEQLIEMNHEERMNTITALQEKLHANNGHDTIESGQDIVENQDNSHESNEVESNEVKNLEHHELQEQMLTHHKIEDELHHHQKLDEQRLENHRLENHTEER